MWIILKDKSDEELVEMAQSGDREAANVLVKRYEKFVRYLGKSYYAKGYTKDDVIQEGLIGLFKAIRTYKGISPFTYYLKISVIGQLNTMVRRIHREKNYINLTCGSLDIQLFDERPEKTLISAIRQTEKSPEEVLIEKEEIEQFYSRIKEVLTPLEQAVIMGYIEDMTYMEIAEQVGRETKTIDNALQRAKQKIRKAYQEAS